MNEINQLKFCPKCGNKTLLWDDVKKWSCSQCDYVLFHNVAGAVAVLICYKNELMLTRRNQDPCKGKLDLSGGFTDPKESAEHTCARELFEELALKIDESKLKYLGSQPNIYVYKNIPYNTIDLFYQYNVEEKFEVSLEESEVSEVIWISAESYQASAIAFDSQRKFLTEYFNKNKDSNEK